MLMEFDDFSNYSIHALEEKYCNHDFCMCEHDYSHTVSLIDHVFGKYYKSLSEELD